MKNKIPGWILTVIMFVVMIFLDYRLITSQLLPMKLTVLITVLLFVLWLIAAILLWTPRRVGQYIFGILLCLLLTVGMGAGFYFLNGALNTIVNITGTQVQVAHMGVYALKESSVQSMEDLTNKSLGILSNHDQENTQSTLQEIEKKLGQHLNPVEYPDIVSLAQSLLDGDSAAVIMNTALLPMLQEVEGFADFENKIREVSTIKIEKVIEAPVKRPERPTTSEQKENRSFVMFMSGVDTYGNISNVSRSDTNILAVINPDSRQVLLLSTPRDYYVPLSISDGIRDKLTHAGIYGVEVSMDTLAMLYDVNVDYYFRVNFSGFEQIVDALGGVTVYSEYDFTAGDSVHFVVGNNDVNGTQALTFARERYAFAEGDRQRGKNQMEVIKAIIRKAVSPAVLTNYSELMTALEGSFQLSMPYDTLASLVRSQLENGGSWNVVSYSVDGFGNSATTYSAPYDELYVMEPNMETVDHAKELISKVFNGDILTQE